MTKFPGIGVMIGMLCGNERTVKAVQDSLGETIRDVKLADNKLVLAFESGSTLRLWDGGQSCCCESRYMNCDDDLAYHRGAKLVKVEIRGVPNLAREWGEHEVQFLDVTTDRGVIQCANHNEHNGYYGGFWIEAEREGRSNG